MYICKWNEPSRKEAEIKIWWTGECWKWYYRVMGPKFQYDQGGWFGGIAGLKRRLREDFYPPKEARFRKVKDK